MDKVFVGIYYETVVITRAKKRADAVPALRAALGERHGREAAPVSLMNHIALVYWSDKRKSSWYRLPGSDDASNRRFAANLMKYQGWRSVAYKGKGVRYVTEVVRKKAGKTGAK